MELDVDPKRLFEGCVLAQIVHTVAAKMYPELSHEHAWDSFNYCTDDSQGCRAVITFYHRYIAAVFQNARCTDCRRNALDFFAGAPEELTRLAKAETLQYVLEDAHSSARPAISAAFWGTWERLYSAQSFAGIVENGGQVIRRQLLPYAASLEEWREYYDFNEEQMALVNRLFAQRMNEEGNTRKKSSVWT